MPVHWIEHNRRISEQQLQQFHKHNSHLVTWILSRTRKLEYHYFSSTKNQVNLYSITKHKNTNINQSPGNLEHMEIWRPRSLSHHGSLQRFWSMQIYSLTELPSIKQEQLEWALQ